MIDKGKRDLMKVSKKKFNIIMGVVIGVTISLSMSFFMVMINVGSCGEFYDAVGKNLFYRISYIYSYWRNCNTINTESTRESVYYPSKIPVIYTKKGESLKLSPL